MTLLRYRFSLPHSCTFSPSAPNPHVLRALKITVIATHLQLFILYYSYAAPTSLLSQVPTRSAYEPISKPMLTG